MPCAWRFPGVSTALVGALFLHRRLTVQSGGSLSIKGGTVDSLTMDTGAGGLLLYSGQVTGNFVLNGSFQFFGGNTWTLGDGLTGSGDLSSSWRAA